MKNDKEKYGNCYKPDSRIIEYVKDRVKMNRISKSKNRSRFSKDENNLDTKLRQDKKRLLENVIFPSMTNLVSFFDYLAKYQELRDLFEDDVKELLGFIGPNAKYEDNIMSRMLQSIFTWDRKNDRDNFRTELISSIQNVLCSKIISFSIEDEKSSQLSMTNGIVIPDVGRSLLYARMFSSKYSYELKKQDQSKSTSRNIQF